MFSVCLYIVRTDDHIHQTEFQTTQIQYADEAEYQQQTPWEFDLDSTSESYINQNHGNVHKGQEDGKNEKAKHHHIEQKENVKLLYRAQLTIKYFKISIHITLELVFASSGNV